MAKIVGYAAMSHSPFWDNTFETEGPGAEFTAGVKQVFDRVKQLEVDLVVIIGPDHFRNYFYGLMPPFCIGAGEIDSFGDYGTHEGSVVGAPEAGQAIIQSIRSRGFDPAFSLRMGIDHGIIQPYEVLFPSMDIPVVPIMVDCGAAPRPTFARSYDFGKAIRQAIDELNPELNVFLIGSGGMSHWVAGNSPYAEDIDEETKDFLMDGRHIIREYNKQREDSVARRIEDGVEGKVNPDWDRWFLEQVSTGDYSAFRELDSDEVEQTAGNGAHEMRAWVAGLAAWDAPIEQIVYEPVPTWSAGMGLIASFADEVKPVV